MVQLAALDLAYSVLAAMLSLALLYYLHDQWQFGWAVGCGAAGAIVQRLVAPSYASLPALLRHGLGGVVVTVGAILAVWSTLMTPDYGIAYLVSVWRQALGLLVVAALLGLGVAGVVYAHRRLEREIEQRQRLEEDLRLARNIQRSLLSEEFPRLHWVDSCAFNVPSRDVGGDYYEIFDDEDTGDLEFAIGDVSGKGVPAALLASTLQSAFLGISSSGDDLAKVCERLNKFLNARTSPERYATFFVGRLTEDAYLAYVNAGHNPPYLLRGDERQRLTGGGMPLGLFPNATYELQKIRLQPGDKLLCFTDGVTEAMNPQDEEFGDDRLLASVGACTDKPAAEIIDVIRGAIHQHTGGAPQHDDLTLMALCLQ